MKLLLLLALCVGVVSALSTRMPIHKQMPDAKMRAMRRLMNKPSPYKGVRFNTGSQKFTSNVSYCVYV
jgi:hypothetical protein